MWLTEVVTVNDNTKSLVFGIILGLIIGVAASMLCFRSSADTSGGSAASPGVSVAGGLVQQAGSGQHAITEGLAGAEARNQELERKVSESGDYVTALKESIGRCESIIREAEQRAKSNTK